MTVSWIIAKKAVFKVLPYNVKSFAFCCRAVGIPGFDQKNTAKMALATVRFWLESNHSIEYHFLYENPDYET